MVRTDGRGPSACPCPGRVPGDHNPGARTIGLTWSGEAAVVGSSEHNREPEIIGLTQAGKARILPLLDGNPGVEIIISVVAGSP